MTTTRTRAALPLLVANLLGLAVGAPVAVVIVYRQLSQTSLVLLAAGVPIALGVTAISTAPSSAAPDQSTPEVPPSPPALTGSPNDRP